MKTGIELIAEERKRQIEKEGWTSEHDDQHRNGEMLLAAVCYATPSDILDYQPDGFFSSGEFRIPLLWPWDNSWWKPEQNRIRELQKAGALIAAEIDRLQREKQS